MGDVDDPKPEVRVGDRERREYDARLQQAYADGVLTVTEYEERSAQAWAARTRSELEPLIRDLPEPETAVTPVESPTPVKPMAPAVVSGTPLRKRVAGGLLAVLLVGVGVYGGSRAIGAADGVQVFGGRIIPVAPDDDRVEFGVLFGGAEIRVPADARVQIEGTVIFGGIDCEEACDGSGTRDVVVNVNGAFGGAEILRPGEESRDDDRGDRGDRNDNDNDRNDNDNGDDDN
jgi:hypothetical protein